MARIDSLRIAKLAYGVVFIVVVPLGLWWWNRHLRCPFPAVRALWPGVALFAGGSWLMLLGMLRLWRVGGGLPMNAFPPPRVVTNGVYALLPHPIYCGFIACCAGAALLSGSASGLWMVTPVAALGCLSIVLGYEAPDLHRRFGSALPAPWLALPQGDGVLSVSRRIGAALVVLLPWALFYFAVKTLGVPADAVETRFGWEWANPVLPSTMPVYASIYLVVPLAFLLCADRAGMRRLVIGGWLATLLNTLFYLTLPMTAAFRAVPGHDWMSQWLMWEQRLAAPAAGSCPSFHVTWAVVCAASLARGALRRAPALCRAWFLGLSLSCLTTGMHSVVDVLAGALTGALCVRPGRLWQHLLGVTERLGNSWNAFQLGPLRIINHGFWSGLAGFAVLFITGASAGSTDLGWVIAIAVCALLGAGLWAQLVEGSSALLRPFGYYGAMLGGLLAVVIIAWLRGPVAELMAAFAVAAPWTQAIGRLRCIVQGCCHGRPVAWGVRVTNPHSRVAKLAGFIGRPVHPTPLYSILANTAIGVLLLRMRVAGAGAFQIAGLYLLLAGMSRFVEEAYRGEPQTARFAGLALYQWMAIGSVVLGMIVMTFRGPAVPPLHAPSLLLCVTSLAWGVVCAFAMSMDFPASNWRLSRLTG